MTGEITLRGRVLPVGGLKEKILAAKLAGIKKVILPAENEIDLSDLPDSVKEDMDFVLVKSMDEVLLHALVNQINKKEKANKDEFNISEDIFKTEEANEIVHPI